MLQIDSICHFFGSMIVVSFFYQLFRYELKWTSRTAGSSALVLLLTLGLTKEALFDNFIDYWDMMFNVFGALVGLSLISSRDVNAETGN